MSKIDTQVLTKRPAESRIYNMDFAGKMEAGETIAGVSSWTSSPDGLTVGSAAYSGQVAQARLSGGTDGVKYLQTVVVTTSAGNTLQAEGYLFVRDRAYG